MEKYDFSGWATRNDLKCSDGRIIRANAFKGNDGKVVPLVYNHDHNDPENVLGHALLENRAEGVYAYCSFNDSPRAQHVKATVQHGDICSLSIYANQLKQMGSDVIHGAIREVSLVLAGANPGAFIDNPCFAHSDDPVEDEATIYTGLPLELMHSDEEYEDDEVDDEYEDDEDEVDDDYDDDEYDDEEYEEYDGSDDDVIEHADSDEEEDEEDEMDAVTIQDVLDTLNPTQMAVVTTVIGKAIADAKNNDSEEGEEEMKHNVFDTEYNDDTLMHSEFMATVINDAKSCGSMAESFMKHSADYGIENIDWLQPEYKNINGDGAPGFIKRNPDDWVQVVMNGVHHTPYAKVKMMFADLREDEARAKGYIKGNLKKEEVFGLLKRQIGPTTIYKKQKFDRDDIVDITDFDVISWVKGEMRTMLDEEIARAVVFGDGRTALAEDKINEASIIPIWKDADLYNIKYTVDPAEGESLAHAIINAAVKAQDNYEGSGNLTAFLKNGTVSTMLLEEDKDGHRMYKDMRELALAMGVDKIVKVPASIVPSEIHGVIVDLKDYNIGADKGGAINMFDDFDIDYNQMKYLIETRCSGALTKPFSAITLKVKGQG